jgi:type II secretory pathway pseudopilin PulG
MANRNSGGYSFLIEALIVTLFFSLSAVILLQVFVAAKLQAQNNTDRNGALLAAQTALETAIAGEPVNTTCWYDSDWQPAGEAEAAFAVTVTAEAEEQAAGRTLYRLEAAVVRTEDGEAVIPPLSTCRTEETP